MVPIVQRHVCDEPLLQPVKYREYVVGRTWRCQNTRHSSQCSFDIGKNREKQKKHAIN
jgi:hypothetical protein